MGAKIQPISHKRAIIKTLKHEKKSTFIRKINQPGSRVAMFITLVLLNYQNNRQSKAYAD